MEGPVRFLIPEGGVSLIDAPGKPFWDPAADQALFAAIESKFRPGPNRRLIKLPHNVNDPEFAQALVDALRRDHRGSAPSRRPGDRHPCHASHERPFSRSSAA